VAFKFALVLIAARIRNLLRDKHSFASQYCFQSIRAQKMSEQKNPHVLLLFFLQILNFFLCFPGIFFSRMDIVFSCDPDQLWNLGTE